MNSATVLHGKQWEATPNEHNAARIPLHQSMLSRFLSMRFELPSWGRFRMTDSGRFSMPYAMLAIMVSLLAVVAAACVTVALAALGAGFWLVTNVTEIKTKQDAMMTEIQAQRVEIGGVRAYANRTYAETLVMKGMLPEKHQQRIDDWERDNPVDKFRMQEKN